MKQNITNFITQYKYYLIILLFLMLYAYWNLWGTFFVADAWHMLDSYIQARDYGLSYFFQLFAMPYGIHFLPIGVLLSTAEAYIFGVNTQGYGMLSLLLHFLNVLLIFYIIIKITKNTIVAFLGAAYFAVNEQIREGVFWFASNTWTEASTLFVMLGLLVFSQFYEGKKMKSFFLSFLFFIIAIFLREYCFMLFPVNIMFLLVLFWKHREKKYISLAGLYVLFVVLYIYLRIYIIHTVSSDIVSIFSVSFDHLFYLLPWYIITLPAKIIATIFIPSDTLIALTTYIATNIYYQIDIAQSAIFKTILFYDQLYILFGFFFLSLTYYIYTKIKVIAKEEIFSIRLFGVVFYILPLIFLTLKGYIYWIPSRYLYLPTAIYLIFLFSCLGFLPLFRKKNFISVAAVIFCVLLIAINAYMNHTYFVSFVRQGSYRLNVLKNVSSKLDFKKQQQILYIQTTTDGRVNDNDIFGVATSFGKELLIWNWYQDTNKKYLPTCLFDPFFLFSNPVNDYKFCQGKGYGYFQDINQLKKTVKKYHLPLEDIVGLTYNPTTNTFTDTTKQIRKLM